MKKNLKYSLIISLIINVIGLITNLICAYAFHILPLSITIPGGEVITYVGFGVVLDKIFVLGLPNSNVGGSSYNISFDIINLLITFVLVFIITLIIVTIINKIKNKKTK